MIDGVQDIWLAMSAPIMAGREPENPVAARLKLLRSVLKYDTSAAFAAFLEMSPQRYNNFENQTPLSIDAALTIVRKVPGMTLDWLYFEKPDGLPFQLARELAGRKGSTSAKPSEAR